MTHSARSRDAVLAPLVVFSFLCSAGLIAEDWPQWRGPKRNGVSGESVRPETWPDGKPALVWEAQVGIGFSSISVVDGRAYTMGHVDGKDVVWCLDASTGRELWARRDAAKLGDDLHEGGPGATPTVDDGRVYTINKWGLVLCLDARSGEVVWRRDLEREGKVKPNDWGFAGSPLILGDRVLLNVGTAGAALDRRTGKTLWLSGTDKAGYASPVVLDASTASAATAGADPTVLIFAAKALVAVNPASGAALWRRPFRTGYDNNNADPIVWRNRILITSYDQGAECLEPTPSGDGVTVRWKERSLSTHMAPPVVVGEQVYGFSGHYGRRATLRCVDLATGKLRWRREGIAAGSVMIAGDALVILDGRGELIVARPDPEELRELARARILDGRCWSPPALADGLLLARNSRGLLRCVRVAPEK